MGSASRATGGTGLKCSPLLLWNLALICLSLTRAETPVAGRRSRQASEAEPRGGVWGAWSPWTDCSQSCGPGVSERRRRCLPPPYVPLDWGLPAFLPPGLPNHTPVISAIRPDYPPPLSFPDPHPYGEQPPFYPQSALPSRNSGLPVFASDRGVAAHDRPGAGASLYRREFPSRGQELLPLYRPSAFPSPPRHYGPLGRSSPPPAGQRTATVRSGESRRSVPTSQDAAVPRRSSSPSASSIRPGQFGYGRVPFSLPLHRPSRNTRHAAHGGNSSSSSTPQLEEVVDQRELASAESDGDLQRAGMGEEGEKHAGEDDPARGGEEREETVAAGPTKAPAGAAGLADPEPAGKRHHEAPTGGLRQPERRRHPDRPPARPAEKHSSTRSSARVHRQADATHDLRYNRRTLPHHFPPHREALYSFSPALDHPPQLPPGPSNPGIWVVPPQHPGRGEADREAGPVGTSWGSHPHLGNFKCSGPEKEHRRCDVQLCPGGAVDPRAEQCSSFNDQEFLGRLYDWEPFTEVGPEQQCELTCRPAGFRFYVRQADVVRDGTPCANNTPGGVCVGGRCLNEGCDGVLGSGLVRDRCGVCGGRETSCRRVAGSFQNTSVPLGYHHILDIPLGATAINITERRASANYLALRSGTGQSVVNGRWAVDPPGEYRAGGTTFLYTRPRGGPEGQEEALGETLTAPGPTTTLLQLFIIHHRKNPGIDYEFYVPVEKEAERGAARGRDGVRAPLGETSALTVTAGDPVPVPPPPAERRWTAERSHPRGPASGRNARIPPRTDLPLDTQPPFVWRRGGLTECSASCGKGFQHRVVRCVNRHTEQDVSERKCDSAAKPGAEEIPCNLHPCPPFWDTGPWSECSVSCGAGLQQRQVQCRQSFGNRSTMVHPQRCSLLPRPNATQPCHPRVCSHWEIRTNWSTCSVDCGVGKRTRNVRCVGDHGSVVSDRECNARLRPPGTEDCHMGPCVTNWYFTDWTPTCSARCGPGVQRREVVCLSGGAGRSQEGGGGGDDCVGEKPVDMKACSGGPCVPTVMWYTGPWGQCNTPCGNGTQRRDVICVQKLGSDFNVTHASRCAHLEKPPPVQTCETEPCRPQWFTTDWSACSRSCGNGLQTREVRCLDPDRRHSSACDLTVKPEQEQLCNTLPCSPQLPDENCRDRRHNCMMVVQARLCVYTYYKTACCASCTQSAQRTKRH